jgi:hypothetical protein|eukprot:COSAG01_NODE_1165_length_11446_cov_16.276196_13_plen_98_part_00
MQKRDCKFRAGSLAAGLEHPDHPRDDAAIARIFARRGRREGSAAVGAAEPARKENSACKFGWGKIQARPRKAGVGFIRATILSGVRGFSLSHVYNCV